MSKRKTTLESNSQLVGVTRYYIRFRDIYDYLCHLSGCRCLNKLIVEDEGHCGTVLPNASYGFDL